MKNQTKSKALFIFGFVVNLICGNSWADEQQGGYVGPKTGEKVAFIGDTITSLGWIRPAGFVHLVDQALMLEGKQIVIIPAGKNGDTSKEILGRLNANVLSRKPDWIVLSCGLTDVWYEDHGVPLDQYKQNITSIITQAKGAGVKVMVLTSSLIGEDPTTPGNKKVEAYNDVLRSIAQEKGLLLADIYPLMQSALAKEKAVNSAETGNLLTTDGVHLNGIGNQVVASGMLTSWGVSNADISQARILWDELHDAMILPPVAATVRQYREMMALAAKRSEALDRWENDTIKAPLPIVQVTLPKPPAPAQKPGH